MRLFVDDERPAPEGWELVTDFREAVRRIDQCRVAGEPFEGLSLDHDLGGDDTTRPIIRYLTSAKRTTGPPCSESTPRIRSGANTSPAWRAGTGPPR